MGAMMILLGGESSPGTVSIIKSGGKVCCTVHVIRYPVWKLHNAMCKCHPVWKRQLNLYTGWKFQKFIAYICHPVEALFFCQLINLFLRTTLHLVIDVGLLKFDCSCLSMFFINFQLKLHFMKGFVWWKLLENVRGRSIHFTKFIKMKQKKHILWITVNAMNLVIVEGYLSLCV